MFISNIQLIILVVGIVIGTILILRYDTLPIINSIHINTMEKIESTSEHDPLKIIALTGFHSKQRLKRILKMLEQLTYFKPNK